MITQKGMNISGPHAEAIAAQSARIAAAFGVSRGRVNTVLFKLGLEAWERMQTEARQKALGAIVFANCPHCGEVLNGDQ